MKFRFTLKSFNKNTINKASKNLYLLCKNLNCKISGIVALPIRIKKYCVLRSPHVNKDSRETFEMRIYKQFFDIILEDSYCLNELLALEIPYGVSCSFKILN